MPAKSREPERSGRATRFTSVYPVALCCSIAAVAACSFNRGQDPPTQQCPNVNGGTGVVAFNGVVREAETPPPPMSGGTLSVLWGGDGSYVLASIPDLDRVGIVALPSIGDAAPKAREIQFDRGSDPGRIIGDGLGHAYVALRNKGAIATVDPSSGKILEQRDVCPAPRGMAWQKATSSLIVACATGELVTMPATGSGKTSVFVDRDLRDVVLLGDTIVVSRFREAEVLTLDASGNIRSRTGLPAMPNRKPHVAWRMTESNGTIAVVYEQSSNGNIDIRRRAVAPVAYYNTANTGVGAPVVAAVATSKTGTTFQLLADPMLATAAPAFDVAISPNGLVSTSGGLTPTFGTTPKDPTVAIGVIGVSGTSPSFRTTVKGLQVQAMTYGGQSVDGQPLLLVQTREPASIQAFNTKTTEYPNQVPPTGALPVWTVALSGVSDTGFDLFHTQTASAIACASCHPEGGDDGHVWHFISQEVDTQDQKACQAPGTGIPAPANERRTQSLRGGILQTAPFHWDGDMNGIGDIMTNVFTNGMAGGEVTPEQSQVVARWINAIPRLPQRVDLEGAKVERGRVLFEGKGGCASCHSGAAFTNNTTVSVANGGGPLQVPNLMGIGDRAPFIHNGCAKTLADRFNPECGGDKHGNALTTDEQSDVITYLESL